MLIYRKLNTSRDAKRLIVTANTDFNHINHTLTVLNSCSASQVGVNSGHLLRMLKFPIGMSREMKIKNTPIIT